MGKYTGAADAATLFEDFSDSDWYRDSGNGFERYWQWPDEIGRGFMYMIKLREGFFLGIGDYLVTERITVDFRLDFSLVVFGFNFLGDLAVDFRHRKIRGTPRQFRQGYSFISHMPRWQGVAEYPAETNCTIGRLK